MYRADGISQMFSFIRDTGIYTYGKMARYNSALSSCWCAALNKKNSFRNHSTCRTHKNLSEGCVLSCPFSPIEIYIYKLRIIITHHNAMQHHMVSLRALSPERGRDGELCGHSLQSSSTSKPGTRTSGCDVCHLQQHHTMSVEYHKLFVIKRTYYARDVREARRRRSGHHMDSKRYCGLIVTQDFIIKIVISNRIRILSETAL